MPPRRSPRLKGRLTKAMLKEAKQTILLAQIMAGEPHCGRLVPAGGPPPLPTVLKVKPVKTARAAFAQAPAQASPARQKPAASTGVAPPQSRKKAPVPATAPRRRAAPKQPAEKKAAARKKARAANGPAAGTAAPVQPQATPAPPEPLPELKVVFETDPAPVLEAIRSQRRSEPEAVQLALQAYRLSFRTSYDQLLCLPTLRDVRSLWYQEDTARKVMKNFRGRAILADEVGLGKTIEAGLILKEYLLRGLVHTALVLTPSSLVAQWQEELEGKFGIPFISTQDELFRRTRTASGPNPSSWPPCRPPGANGIFPRSPPGPTTWL